MHFSYFSGPEMSFRRSLHTFDFCSGLLNMQQPSWTSCLFSLSRSLTYAIHLEATPVFEDLVRHIVHAAISYTACLYEIYMHSIFI